MNPIGKIVNTNVNIAHIIGFYYLYMCYYQYVVRI